VAYEPFNISPEMLLFIVEPEDGLSPNKKYFSGNLDERKREKKFWSV